MRHRGPDDEGRWISPSGRAAFAHTRLSILDLSAAGHQPMHDTSGRFTITFNGEIYNFRELRESLARDGVAFHTDSDTEVLLALYARRGEAMVRELRGMFAFAIWDEREQTCFLARDP
ncbi:MAG: asparagine synthetase B, partial [Verrucomicrobiaceae bacterium]|nr:asparagine synthetase B [Verrucomicrobiaceae bacterium]